MPSRSRIWPAVQWQTVVVLRHRHLDQQRLGRQAAGDGAVRRRSLNDRLGAAPAAVDRTLGDPDAQAQRHGIEALGLLDADRVQGAAAARAAPVLRLDHHLIALEMGRQVAEVAPGRSPPGAPVRVAVLSVLPRGLGRRDLLLEVFQGELELLGIEAFGLAAELRPQELPDHQLQPLALGIGLLEGALEVITLALQAIPLIVKSIERDLLPLNDTFHLDQPCQELIWIERIKGRVCGHAAIILASYRQIHIIPLSRRPSGAAPAEPADAPKADRRAEPTAAAPTAGPHHRSPAATRTDQLPTASSPGPDPSRRRRAA